MTTIAPVPETDAGEPDTFKPLTAEQARLLRNRTHQFPLVVVAGAGGGGLVVALAAWGITGRQNVGWSAGYGAWQWSCRRPCLRGA